MGAWVKFFKDRTTERGSDLDIEEKKASWSKGRLDDIISVQISQRTLCGVMSIPDTEWHQYDRYMASLSVGPQQSFRSARVIQAKVNTKHLGKNIIITNSTGIISIELTNQSTKDTMPIKSEHVGLWITLYILANGETGITFCERGAFNGDKQILK